jgi:hypothetical protein
MIVAKSISVLPQEQTIAVQRQYLFPFHFFRFGGMLAQFIKLRHPEY